VDVETSPPPSPPPLPPPGPVTTGGNGQFGEPINPPANQISEANTLKGGKLKCCSVLREIGFGFNFDWMYEKGREHFNQLQSAVLQNQSKYEFL